jgi:hypothetical protein
MIKIYLRRPAGRAHKEQQPRAATGAAGGPAGAAGAAAATDRP